MGILEDVMGDCALEEADALGRRAASVGFDWEEAADALEKVREEVEELSVLLDQREEPAGGEGRARQIDELGDLLFAVVNVARKLDIDPREALRRTNQKFRRRFASIEAALAAEGARPREVGLERLEALWVAAKDAEGEGPSA